MVVMVHLKTRKSSLTTVFLKENLVSFQQIVEICLKKNLALANSHVFNKGLTSDYLLMDLSKPFRLIDKV